MPRRDEVAVLLGLTGPFVVTVLLVPFRDNVANTNAALVLVLVIVAVATSGNRAAGAVAAVSTAACFDFFLTRPYETFAIHNRTDLETTVLLLAVGLGVTEVAAWGYRQRARADRASGYLSGIGAAAAAVAVGGSSGALIDTVSEQLVRLLDLRHCRFQYGVAGLGKPPRLCGDGRVEWRGAPWDVEHRGLPVDTDIELLVESKGNLQGRFLLNAAPDAHPSLDQRRVAVMLAEQVGSSLR